MHSWHNELNLPAVTDTVVDESVDDVPHNWNEYQQSIRRMHAQIDTLKQRLEITKAFSDSLWEQLREYER